MMVLGTSQKSVRSGGADDINAKATGLKEQVTGVPGAINNAGSNAPRQISFTPVQRTAIPHTPTPSGAYQAPLNVPVFSRRREVLVGRVAMAGFYASCMWESFLMGLGPIGQASVLSGLPAVVVQAVLAGFVLHGLWGLAPFSITWSKGNRNDLLRRPVGPPRKFVNLFAHPDEFCGYSPVWGFTKANEVFAGRLAMLGFLGTCAAEQYTHTGALGQIAAFLHLPVTSQYFQLCEVLLITSSVAFGVLAYVNKHPGQLKGGDDIY